MFRISIVILIVLLEDHQGACMGVSVLIILLQSSKIISHTSHCTFSHLKETRSDTSSCHCTDKVVGGEGWPKDRVEKKNKKETTVLDLFVSR